MLSGFEKNAPEQLQGVIVDAVNDIVTVRPEDGSGGLEFGRGMALQPIKATDIATTVLDLCRG